jgi:(aminoalkyl)phosphonate N-acetyltransferase
LHTSQRDSNDAILIREIALSDAEAAAQLSSELGYPAEVAVMRERIAVVNASSNRVVYVACIANTMIAWIEVAIVHHLSTGAQGEIGGLVVSGEYRGRGIGQELITNA